MGKNPGAPALSLFFFAFALAFCAAAYQPARIGIAIDNQTFFYIAERAASGVPPHASVVNHKQALAHLLSAGAIAAGRALGVDDVTSGRTLSVVVLAAIVGLTVSLARELTGHSTAAAVTGLAMLTFSGLLRQGAMGFRPQLFATFFVLLAVLATGRGKDVRAGAYAACAFLCWQPAVAALAGVLGASLPGDRVRERVAAAGAGAIAVLAVYETYFAVTGALGEQLFQTWVMAGYGALTHVPSIPRSLAFVLWQVPHAGLARAIVPAALPAAAVLLAWRAFRDLQAARPAWHTRTLLRACVLTAACALVLTFVDHQAYPDKFFLLPFMAVAAGWLVSVAADAPALRGMPRGTLAGGCALLLALLAISSIEDYGDRKLDLAGQRELARKVKTVGGKHGSIWAIGCLHLLGLNRQANYTEIGVLIDPRVRRHARSLYPHLRPTPMPRVILLARLLRPPRWLAREYRDLTTTDFARDGIAVWIRKAA